MSSTTHSVSNLSLDTMSDRLTTAYIDLAAYRHNLEVIKSSLAPQVEIMAVLKANAYGHGIVEIAKAAVDQGVKYLGVVCLYEVRQLRSAGITHPIILINYLDPASFSHALDFDVTITVMDAQAIKTLSNLAQKRKQKVKVHLKVDTGMHRAGCDPDECVALATRIAQSPHLELEGVYTHFADADNQNQAFTLAQLREFQKLIQCLARAGIHPPLIHAANSAATLALPELHFTLVRPGIATYGINPFEPPHPLYDKVAQSLKPVLTLSSQIIHIRTIPAGESVGYGCGARTTRETRVALVPIGYGDGYMRSTPSMRAMLVHSQRAPLIGRVSMDQTCIDITDIDAKVRDEVVIIGSQNELSQSAVDLARQSGTISYEVLTALSSRVTRCYTTSI